MVFRTLTGLPKHKPINSKDVIKEDANEDHQNSFLE
jgi:hypothetical protein